MSSISRVFTAAVVGVVFAAPVWAQDTVTCACAPHHDHTPSELEKRSAFNIAFVQSRPTGAFQKNVGLGYGANVAYLFRVDKAGWLSLRADGGFAVYGNEHFHAPLSPTIGGRIQVKVNTNNNVIPLSIGPQLQVPTGRVRPYVHAGIGGQYFFTQSNVEGEDSDWDFASTTHQSDWTSAWVAGGGVYIPVSEGKTKVALDFGVHYYNGGRAQYLKPGSIQDLPDTQIRITPLESETHMMLVRIGVRIGL
jgi:opacity protein-like surface antigen